MILPHFPGDLMSPLSEEGENGGDFTSNIERNEKTSQRLLTGEW